MPFATQSADSCSTSMGSVDLQPNPLIGVLLISSTWQSSPRADSTLRASPCATASKWSRVFCTVTVPKYYAVASEVATMDLLCSAGLPIPEVYGYSPESDNAAGAKYIFMEFVRGTK